MLLIDAYFAARTKRTIVLISVTLLLLVGFMDYWTGIEYGVSLFYLLPALLMTWYVGQRSGMIVAVAGALSWWLTNFLAGEIYSSIYVPIWNTAIRLGLFSIVVLLLSHSKTLLDRQNILAYTDYLTGAWNSRAFYQKAAEELDRAYRSQQPLSLIYIDLDNFKFVNDTYGHSAGNTVLIKLVQTAQARLRAGDLLARMGGDEFIVLLPNTSRVEAESVALRMQDEFTQTMVQQGRPVTLSAGVVTYTAQPPTVDSLLKVADDMMFMAKSEGKNRISAAAYKPAGTRILADDLIHEIERYVSI